MNAGGAVRRRPGPVAAVFLFVVVAQLALVAIAGTDVPFQDQWDIEGRWLYPAFRTGQLHLADLLRPLNEHRIAWTHALNVALFSWNGQWDPLVQLGAIALLRATCAAGLAWGIAAHVSARGRWVAASAIALAFLPHLAWHNVLWGNQSQVLFALGWSLTALWLLGKGERTSARTLAGIAAGLASLLAMAPAALVPVALLGLAAVRAVERRRIDGRLVGETWPACGLLVAAWFLRVPVPEHTGLHAASVTQFLTAAATVLAWPHGGMLAAAIVLNLPVALVVLGRITRRRTAVAGEDFMLLLAGWSGAIALATAWARGGSGELAAGVPSRYVDFIVLLPLANAWSAVALARSATLRWPVSRWVAGAWVAYLIVGWLGLSAEVMRGLVLPRARDRGAPVRLIRAYQSTGDARVFAGQPRVLVPHPNPESVRTVLADPRMRGVLPPSLQPEVPMGPLSRAVRALLGRNSSVEK